MDPIEHEAHLNRVASKRAERALAHREDGDPGEFDWGEKQGRIFSRMPPETKLTHGDVKRRGTVSDPVDMEMRKKLAATIAMTQGNSPLDPLNSDHVPNLAAEHKKLKKNLLHSQGMKGVKKLRDYKPRGKRGSKTEKGGTTFTTMQNRLVYPQGDPYTIAA